VGPGTGLDTAEKRKFLSPRQESNTEHRSPRPQPVTIPTELPQLLLHALVLKLNTGAILPLLF
jgi:hypothetical protein